MGTSVGVGGTRCVPAAAAAAEAGSHEKRGRTAGNESELLVAAVGDGDQCVVPRVLDRKHAAEALATLATLLDALRLPARIALEARQPDAL